MPSEPTIDDREHPQFLLLETGSRLGGEAGNLPLLDFPELPYEAE